MVLCKTMEETSNTDIYADLPKFKYNDGIEELQANVESLNEKIGQLNETLIRISKEREEYQTKCATLAVNISSLLKTAQTEIQRKDTLISKLRTQIAESGKQTENFRERRPPLENSCNGKKNDNKGYSYNNNEINLSEGNKYLRDRNHSQQDTALSPKDKSNDTNHLKTTIGPNKNLSVFTSSYFGGNTRSLMQNVNCKTLYSQRMLKKIYSLSGTVGYQEKVLQGTEEKMVELNDKQPVRNHPNSCQQFQSASPNGKEADSCKEGNDCHPNAFEGNTILVGQVLSKELDNCNRSTDIHNRVINDNMVPAPKDGEEVMIKGNEGNQLTENKLLGTTINGEKLTSFHTIDLNKNLDMLCISLKTLAPLEFLSVDSDICVNRAMPNSEDRREINNSEKKLCFGESLSLHSPSPSETKENSKLNETNNESSQFLRPLSSKVIKKPGRKILPVSNWNGLVKTVDNINICLPEKKLTTGNDPINVQINSEEKKCSFNEEEKQENDKPNCTQSKDSLLDHLFGSPLKWTENSNEPPPALDLSSPAIYEDSCSAHIENTKFSATSEKLPGCKSLASPSGTPIYNKHKSYCDVLTDLKGEIHIEKEIFDSKSVRAFEKVASNEQKIKSIFSPLKNSDSCKSATVNLNKDSSIELSINFPFKSKYEDSVLGQFDDTTQFVSALTKVESKISPLNTPVKSSETKSTVTNLGIVEEKAFSQVQHKLEINNVPNLVPSPNNNSAEKPINILYPRKTPRVVVYNRSKEENLNKKLTPTPLDTPTKVAINDSFICQQEEKVRRISKSNLNDPIAITIFAKTKHREKDCSHQAPQGKKIQSPKKTKINSPSWTKCLDINSQNFQKYENVTKCYEETVLHNHDTSFRNRIKRVVPSCPKERIEKPETEVESSNIERKQGRETDIIEDVHGGNLSNKNKDESRNKCKRINSDPFSNKRKRCDGAAEDKISCKGNVDFDLKHSNTNSGRNLKRDIGSYRNQISENTCKHLKESLDKNNTINSKPFKDLHQIELKDLPTNSYKIVSTNSMPTIKKPDKSRIQDFKPSSHLKDIDRHSLTFKKQESERIVKNNPTSPNNLPTKNSANLKELNSIKENTLNSDNEKNSTNVKEKTLCQTSNNERANDQEYTGHIQHSCSVNSSSFIVRSSKKIEFVSTTHSDDNCVTAIEFKKHHTKDKTQLIKKPKLWEWDLKPISFESNQRSSKKMKLLEDPSEATVNDPNKKSNRNPAVATQNSNSIAPLRRTSSRVSFSGCTPNNIILARRPLNFGVCNN